MISAIVQYLPSPMSTRFREADGGNPYDPIQSDAAGQTMNGHHPAKPKPRETYPWKAVAEVAADSKVVVISMARCCARSSESSCRLYLSERESAMCSSLSMSYELSAPRW